MEQRIILPAEYGRILLTDNIRDWAIWRDARFRYEIGQEKKVKPVLLAPSRKYEGLLVIDGNHRAMAVADIGREVRSYVFYSEEDREEIHRLQTGNVLALGGLSFNRFIHKKESFNELIEEAEASHKRNGELNLELIARRGERK